jgi:hypothetical protein
MNNSDCKNMEIEDVLPGCNDHHRYIPIPSRLRGATIVDIGAAPVEMEIEGGGLVIDYRAAESSKIQRLVLAFTELGMWIERETTLGSLAK